MGIVTNMIRLVPIGGLAAMVSLAPSPAQPTEDARSGVPAESAEPAPSERESRWRIDDPEVLRSRIETAIERGEAMLARQRAALERLDAGESPAEVMRTLRSRPFQGMDGPRRDRAQPRRSDAAGEGGPDAQSGTDPQSGPSVEEMRAVVREYFPRLHEQLEMIRASNPEAGQRLFMRMSPRIREIALDMRHDPELGRLRVTEVSAGLGVGDATRAYREAQRAGDPDAIASATESLRAAIGAQFDARMALRQHEVERLVGRIGELNEEILGEIAGRDAAIESVFAAIVQRSGRGGPGRRP